MTYTESERRAFYVAYLHLRRATIGLGQSFADQLEAPLASLPSAHLVEVRALMVRAAYQARNGSALRPWELLNLTPAARIAVMVADALNRRAWGDPEVEPHWRAFEEAGAAARAAHLAATARLTAQQEGRAT